MEQKRWAVAASPPSSFSSCSGGSSATSGFSARLSARLPAVARERDAARRLDTHTFVLETKPLRHAGAGVASGQTELPLGVDHPVPRQRGAGLQCVERVADEP